MNSAGPTTDEGYTLRYGPAATAAVKSSLHLAVRPHLQDVRAMLRLPLPDAGITAGWLGSTVIVDGKVGLLVDAVALYWGVRRRSSITLPTNARSVLYTK